MNNVAYHITNTDLQLVRFTSFD